MKAFDKVAKKHSINEIMEQTGYTEMGLRFFGTPCYAKRAVNGKRLILLE